MAINYYTATDSTSDTTWSSWNSGTISNYYSNDVVWGKWTNSETATTPTCISPDSGTAWYNWNNTYKYSRKDYDSKPIELTEEQKIEGEIIRLRIEEENRQRQIKEKEKEEKARQLLREVLSEEQNKQFDKDRYFELVSINSGKKYRIRKGRTRNIEEIDNQGKKIRSLCFHPSDYVHDYDTLTIQKLMLENNEEEALKVANFS